MSPPIPSTYLMNDIPRGTSPEALLCSLAEHWQVHAGSVLHYPLILQMLIREPTIHNSQLDDDLSVATIQFKLESTPTWFKMLERDAHGFPKTCNLGTLWRGVDLAARDEHGRNALSRAVVAGNFLMAETLAEFAETDGNAKDNDGRTALHLACVEQLPEMTALLLTVPGLDSGVRDATGLTAFDISLGHAGGYGAVQAAAEAIPSMFYRSMFEMDKVDPDSALLRLLTVTSEPVEGAVFPGEALFRPAVASNLPLVKALMDSGVDLTATTQDDETALHLAAKQGHAEIVKVLLGNSSRGKTVDVEAVAKDGLTALHYAAGRGHQRAVEELLLHGACRDATDGHGLTAFDRAVERSHLAVQEILKPKQTEHTVSDSEPEGSASMSMTTGNGAFAIGSLGFEEQDGQSALHQAAQSGQIAFLQTLLDRGFSVDARNEDMETALYVATGAGHRLAVRLLLDNGADIELMCVHQMPLHLAVSLGNYYMVELLLNYGANIEARAIGRTALHLAAAAGDGEMIRLLLDMGADIEAPTHSGELFLFYRYIDRNGLVKRSLSQGAENIPQDALKWTALHLAASIGDDKTVRLLLHHGANPLTPTAAGLSAAQLANAHVHPKTAQLLMSRNDAL